METISEARKNIETIDAQIISLIAKRQQCAQIIGRNKAASGTNVFVPDREEELLQKLEKTAATVGVPNANIRAIFREIISASVALQMQKPIAYLGPAGTFTHQIARQKFGGSIELLPMRTAAEALVAVQSEKVAYAILPIENSLAGTVTEVLDLLVETDLKIVAQTQLAVEQCLISRGKIEEIKTVCSRDVAIDQCTNWLRNHLPNANLVNETSTAAAVKKAAENPEVAAIASEIAGEIYGVPVLEKGIQNLGENATRFVVIAKKSNPKCQNCEEKTALAVLVKNETGTLFRVLEPFAKHGINLTSLTSRPVLGRKWEYRFFIDFVGSWDDENFQRAIGELREIAVSVKHLGSFPSI